MNVVSVIQRHIDGWVNYHIRLAISFFVVNPVKLYGEIANTLKTKAKIGKMAVEN